MEVPFPRASVRRLMSFLTCSLDENQHVALRVAVFTRATHLPNFDVLLSVGAWCSRHGGDKMDGLIPERKRYEEGKQKGGGEWDLAEHS